MFKSFSASYAGHVVDDQLGLDGTPANDRWYPNEQLAEAFDWALDFSRHLEANGYDEFWMAEHHFQPEGYECIPNLLMLGLYLACNTQRFEIRMRVQHHSDVASAAAGGGFRHGRYPVGRSHRVRCGTRISFARG